MNQSTARLCYFVPNAKMCTTALRITDVRTNIMISPAQLNACSSPSRHRWCFFWSNISTFIFDDVRTPGAGARCGELCAAGIWLQNTSQQRESAERSIKLFSRFLWKLFDGFFSLCVLFHSAPLHHNISRYRRGFPAGSGAVTLMGAGGRPIQLLQHQCKYVALSHEAFISILAFVVISMITLLLLLLLLSSSLSLLLLLYCVCLFCLFLVCYTLIVGCFSHVVKDENTIEQHQNSSSAEHVAGVGLDDFASCVGGSKKAPFGVGDMDPLLMLHIGASKFAASDAGGSSSTSKVEPHHRDRGTESNTDGSILKRKALQCAGAALGQGEGGGGGEDDGRAVGKTDESEGASDEGVEAEAPKRPRLGSP